MRICILSARFPPQRCGVGDYTCFLATALAQVGHEVDVLTGVGELDELLYPVPRNVHIHRVISKWGVSGLADMLAHLRRLRPQLLLIQYAPHAFHRRGITFAVNLLPIVVRTFFDISVATNFHELYIPFGNTLKRILGSLWQRAMVVLMAFGSDTLSVTAPAWQLRLRRLGIGKSTPVIPVGSNVPLSHFDQLERDRFRKQLLNGSVGLVLVGFGALHDRDVPAVLFGLKRLKTELPVKLIWIGGGSPDREHTLRITEAMRQNGLGDNDVIWVGELSHPEISRLLFACDLMVLPFNDGISSRRTSAITAFQHGLPLLTTFGPHRESCFIHGENSYLTPIGDRQGFAEGLVELSRSSALRSRLAQGGRALYRSHFAWDVIAERISDWAVNATELGRSVSPTIPEDNRDLSSSRFGP